MFYCCFYSFWTHVPARLDIVRYIYAVVRVSFHRAGLQSRAAVVRIIAAVLIILHGAFASKRNKVALFWLHRAAQYCFY